jgi:signal transduction histidine kinase
MPMEPMRSQAIKGKPIFKKHLYISTILFGGILLLTTAVLLYLAQESSRERIAVELRLISEDYAKQVRELIAFGSETQSLKGEIDGLLATQNEVVYLFVQDLAGRIVAQGFKPGRELEQIHFPQLLVTPKNPRPPETSFSSIQNPAEELVDRIVILPSPQKDQLLYIHIGISQTLLQRNFSKWKGTIFSRILFTSAGIVILLFFVLLYMLWLLKKAQMVEAEAHAADQLAYLGTLASGLAHEIRNPLSAMNLNLQMIEEDLQESASAQNDDVALLLQSTRQEIRRLERLANHFLLYAKPFQLNRQEFDVRVLLEEVVNLIRQECQQEQIELLLQTPSMPLLFNLDRDLLKQAILNLVLNALDAVKTTSTSRKQITICAEIQAGRLRVQVRDSGPGVGSEEASQIFKVFFSGKRGGTGLGLPIAQRIMESHGGTIHWQNRPESGAEFTLEL